VKRAALLCTVAAVVSACGGDPLTPAQSNVARAPTYSWLYQSLFAVGKPGHCASATCHGEPGNVWLCGGDAHTCYAGMVSIGLVDPAQPRRSAIIDSTQSPLSWFNPVGDMPFDSPGPYPDGRDAIAAWVAAGALDN
jgi:hypothetical protein